MSVIDQINNDACLLVPAKAMTLDGFREMTSDELVEPLEIVVPAQEDRLGYWEYTLEVRE